MNRIACFSFRKVGVLARNPEAVAVDEQRYFVRFCLVSNEIVVEDPPCPCNITTAWFVAVGDLGDELLNEAHKSEQLIVEGTILTRHWTHPNVKFELNRKMNQDLIFLVTGYCFGDRHFRPGAAGVRVSGKTPKPRDGAAEVATIAA